MKFWWSSPGEISPNGCWCWYSHGYLYIDDTFVSMDERLKLHEGEHVIQQREEGLYRMVWRYFAEYRANREKGMDRQEAYRTISYERKAREAEEGIRT